MGFAKTTIKTGDEEKTIFIETPANNPQEMEKTSAYVQATYPGCEILSMRWTQTIFD